MEMRLLFYLFNGRSQDLQSAYVTFIGTLTRQADAEANYCLEMPRHSLEELAWACQACIASHSQSCPISTTCGSRFFGARPPSLSAEGGGGAALLQFVMSLV